MYQKILSVGLIILAYLFINIPTLHDGLFHVYDNVQVTRIEAMYRELGSGQFPVRYIDSFGHGAGYFLFKYYSPLLYYVGSAFMFLGFSAIKAVKLIYLIMSALGAIGCYKWIRNQTKHDYSATIGTLAFVTAPYVYHDFFHRGSMTEAGAMMLMPWAMWAYSKIMQNHSTRDFSVAALIFGSLILTHTLTGVMAAGLLLLYLAIRLPKREIVIKYILSMLLALGIAGFSLVPAIFEKHYIQYENNSLLTRGYLDHPVGLLAQLTNQGAGEEKSAYLGITLMSVYGVLIVLAVGSPKFREKYGNQALFILIAATIGLYLIAPSSAWIWERVIYLRYFQFPFRLLTVVSVVLCLGLSVVSAYYRSFKVVMILLTVLVIAPVFYGRSYYRPLGYQYGTRYSVDDPCRTTTWADEYLSKWSTQCLLSPLPSLVSPVSGNVVVSDIQVKANGRNISFKTMGVGEVQVAKYYTPEWIASDDTGAKLLTTPYSDHGLIKIMIDRHEDRVQIEMLPSTASRWGDLISIISAVICAVALRQKKSEN